MVVVILGTENLYPLVVKSYGEDRGQVCSRFWHMCLVSDCTAGIFTELRNVAYHSTT